jgi:hypothetical protein
MEPGMIDEISSSLGLEPSDIQAVIAEFSLQLHKRALEYKGLNGDFIGEKLSHEIPPQAFYHLLGFLDYFSDRYSWSPGDATEYLLRLGTRAHWSPFNHQMTGWKITRNPAEKTNAKED